MDNELQSYRYKISKAQMILSLILLVYILLQVLSHQIALNVGWGLGMAISLVVIDTCLYLVKSEYYLKMWFVLRAIEFIIISIALIEANLNISTLMLGVILILTILGFLMKSDFTDTYARGITIIFLSIPFVLYLVGLSIIVPINQNKFFELLCAYAVIIIAVINISDLIAQVINNTDKKVFELRRLSENMNMTNEALRAQQEKVKRANEELGIQKIKLETAYEKINNANAETTIQNLIMKYISSSLEITTLLNLITESVLEAIGLDLCAILIQPGIAGNEEILYRIRTRLDDESKNLLSNKISHGCMEEYIHAEGTYIDNNVEEEKYSFLSNRKVGSLLIAPLVREKHVIGALICGKSQYNFFHDNIMFFETVVTQLLIAIHNASLYSKMQQMAIRDSLTGIYNRGQLNVLVDQYSKEALEKKTPLSIALFDIDHFKKINDTYGHLFGDEIIKEIAEYAQDIAVKHNGIAARYGGEEFVLVFQNKDLGVCTEIVEELRQRIEKMQIPYEGDIVTAKVSFGLASYPETCKHIRELLNRADASMYYSKRKGRNQVTIDSDEVQDTIKKEKK